MSRKKSVETRGGSPGSSLRNRIDQIRSAERAGESLKSYAERHGISVGTLYQAKKQARQQGLLPPHRVARKVKRKRSRAAVDGPRFIEAVARPATMEGTPSWRLRLASGEVLESSTRLSVEEIVRVIEVLRGRS